MTAETLGKVIAKARAEGFENGQRAMRDRAVNLAESLEDSSTITSTIAWHIAGLPIEREKE